MLVDQSHVVSVFDVGTVDLFNPPSLTPPFDADALVLSQPLNTQDRAQVASLLEGLTPPPIPEHRNLEHFSCLGLRGIVASQSLTTPLLCCEAPQLKAAVVRWGQ